MKARRLTTVSSFFVIIAVCGLVLASHPKLRQNRKAAHIANSRANSSSGAQWRWQNPLPQGNNLRGVSVVNANTGTLVGDYGTIVRTTDGGNNWTIQSSGTKQTLWAVSSQIQAMERLSAKIGRSSEPQMVALTGCHSQVERC